MRAVSAAMRSVHAIASSQPPPSAEPVDRRDHGLAHVLDQVEDMLPALRVLLALRRPQRGELVDVGAGDECFFTRAGDDHDTNRRVLLQVQHGMPQFVGRRGIERVEDSGTVDREDRDGAVAFEEEVVKSHEVAGGCLPTGASIPHAQQAKSAMAAPSESAYQSAISAERPATNR